MKRVKIMLSAIAVLAVVGGALAFNAKNAYTGPLRCGFTTNSCPFLTYTTSAEGDFENMWCTDKASPSTSCITFTTVDILD